MKKLEKSISVITLAFSISDISALTLNPSPNNREKAYYTIEKAINPPKPNKTVDIVNPKSMDLADCSHKGTEHIVVEFDSEVKTNVFKILSHKIDGDGGCKVDTSVDYTKARTEIKLPAGSPFVAILGTQVTYSWKFKLNNVSPTNTENFHTFQLKARSDAPKPLDLIEQDEYNNKLDPRVRFSLKDRTQPESEYGCNTVPFFTDLTNLEETDLAFSKIGDKEKFDFLCQKNLVVGGAITWEVNAINDSRSFQSLYRQDISEFNNKWFEATVVAKIIDKDHGNFNFELKKLNKETNKFEHYHGFNTDMDLWGDVLPYGEWSELYPKIGMYFKKSSNFDKNNGFSDSSMSVYDIKFNRIPITKK